LGSFTASGRKIAILASVLLLTASVAATTSTKPKSKSSRHISKTTAHVSRTSAKSHSKSHSKKDQSWRQRQKAIDGLRVREIQSALIRQHYLDGDPNGVWDARTKAAMIKYQGEQGWQTKKVPDSRALIRLGLGPDRANLLNPDTASIGQPEPGKGGSPQN
jgi:Putative peptidoglycan binding domain